VVVLCCRAVSGAVQSTGEGVTDLIPLIDAASGPLASILDLFELSD
jgi:hypothetical protein